MAKFSLLSVLTLSFLLLLHGSVAVFFPGQSQQPPQPRYRDQSECNLKRLDALEPIDRIESEAGVSEYWDPENEQLKCVGVAVRRLVIQPKGLLLPSFFNGPMLSFVVQGKGIRGVVIPGCPETYQSFQQPQQSRKAQSQDRYGDKHQKVRQLSQEDIFATPTGVVEWIYNSGDKPLTIFNLLDTGNNENQLDRNPREFLLAAGNVLNIFHGFTTETLAESFNVEKEIAHKLKGENDERGNIIRVENGLEVIMPPTMKEEQQQQRLEERRSTGNGIEEALCNTKLRINIGDPTRADVYNPQAGRVSRFDSQKLSILGIIQLNAVRGVLKKNAILAPHWNDAHSMIYVTRGSAQVQIVGNYDKPVFNGNLSEGQVLTVPQNFVVLKKAGNEGFEWIEFKTNGNVRVSPLAGSDSAIRAMPEEVLMNSYQISWAEARMLKYGNDQKMVFSPKSKSEYRASV